jgi:hypothetical protein
MALFFQQLLTDEEEVADALLSLSQTPSACEFTADRVIADNTNTNVSSASYSEGLSALFSWYHGNNYRVSDFRVVFIILGVSV